MHRRAFVYAFAFALVLSATPKSRADLVVNGDFEAVQIGSPFVSGNPADIPGWTHTGPRDGLLWGVGYADGGGSVTTAGHGNQFVTLGAGFNGTGTGTWSQTLVGLTAGSTYQLDFLMASENHVLAQSITVDFTSGSSTASQTFSAAAPSADYWRDWEAKTMTFVADTASVGLRFSSSSNYDTGLDYVRVNLRSVPEPGSLALLGLGGLALAGYARRRRGMTAP